MEIANNIMASLAATATTSTSSVLQNERQVIRKTGRQAIASFLEQHTCFSVLRASGKVVVFDTRIPIQLAFYALVEHDMQCAPLWDSSLCQFVGLLTVTDFIDILRQYRTSGENVANLSTRTIADVLTILHQPNNPSSPSSTPTTTSSTTASSSSSSSTWFWSADANTSLRQACHLLHQQTLDFLPILMPEDMRVLACITYTNILEHLVTNFREQRRLFDDSIYDLGIGTYHNKLVSITPQQTLADALEVMFHHGLSAIPVVDNESGKLAGVYSRSDITFLTKATDAQDAVANLDLTLEQVLAQQAQQQEFATTPDALHTCSPNHTLQSIFEYFAQLRFNRLFVVDTQDRVMGVVSARDLVAYFLDDSPEHQQ